MSLYGNKPPSGPAAQAWFEGKSFPSLRDIRTDWPTVIPVFILISGWLVAALVFSFQEGRSWPPFGYLSLLSFAIYVALLFGVFLLRIEKTALRIGVIFLVFIFLFADILPLFVFSGGSRIWQPDPFFWEISNFIASGTHGYLTLLRLLDWSDYPIFVRNLLDFSSLLFNLALILFLWRHLSIDGGTDKKERSALASWFRRPLSLILSILLVVSVAIPLIAKFDAFDSGPLSKYFGRLPPQVKVNIYSEVQSRVERVNNALVIRRDCHFKIWLNAKFNRYFSHVDVEVTGRSADGSEVLRRTLTLALTDSKVMPLDMRISKEECDQLARFIIEKFDNFLPLDKQLPEETLRYHSGRFVFKQNSDYIATKFSDSVKTYE